jgi:predicted glycoside hydrolase/deacetylase ChbG (UPF0249 family)
MIKTVSDSITSKKLVVVADDFGFSQGVTDGCIESMQQGILTEMSFMVGAPASNHSVAKVKHLALEDRIGIHITLNNMGVTGKYLRKSDYDTLLDSKTQTELAELVVSELDEFEDLFGQPPSHINSHKNLHQHPKIREVVADYATRNNVYVRRTDDFDDPNIIWGDKDEANGYFRKRGVLLTDNIFENINGTYAEAKEGFINKLKTVAEKSVTEIFLHPAYVDKTLQQYTSLLNERDRDRKLLQDREFIASIYHLGFDITNFKAL